MVCFCGRFPVFCTDNGQTDLTLLINVGMIDLCLEIYPWRLERVLSRKIDFNSESTFVVRWIVLKKQNNATHTSIRESEWTLNLMNHWVRVKVIFPFVRMTYRQYETLPSEDIRFVHLYVCEVLHSRSPEIAQFLRCTTRINECCRKRRAEKPAFYFVYTYLLQPPRSCHFEGRFFVEIERAVMCVNRNLRAECGKARRERKKNGWQYVFLQMSTALSHTVTHTTTADLLLLLRLLFSVMLASWRLLSRARPVVFSTSGRCHGLGGSCRPYTMSLFASSPKRANTRPCPVALWPAFLFFIFLDSTWFWIFIFAMEILPLPLCV